MGIRLFWEKVNRALRKRVKTKGQEKTYEAWAAKGYNNVPLVSFVIQSHNASVQVKHIVSKLRGYPESEIIVIDDGSELKHTKALAKFLDRGNELLFRMNDLYEVVTYDRAMRLANGKYVVLLQDDDDFENLSWVDQGLEYFEQYPEMVILGGKNGARYMSLDEESKKQNHLVKRDIEDDTKGEFKFVQVVNRAPMWVARELFLDKLKYIDFSFAPFQYDDCELCMRAWKNGLKVGWYPAGFYNLSAGGMRIWNRGLGAVQSKKNANKFYTMYESFYCEMDALIKKANQEIGIE